MDENESYYRSSDILFQHKAIRNTCTRPTNPRIQASIMNLIPEWVSPINKPIPHVGKSLGTMETFVNACSIVVDALADNMD